MALGSFDRKTLKGTKLLSHSTGDWALCLSVVSTHSETRDLGISQTVCVWQSLYAGANKLGRNT